jgi:hypothetical protein
MMLAPEGAVPGEDLEDGRLPVQPLDWRQQLDELAAQLLGAWQWQADPDARPAIAHVLGARALERETGSSQ